MACVLKLVAKKVLDSTPIRISLTKFNVLNPFKKIQCMVLGRDYFYMFADTWIHCWKQTLFGKKWKLWVPISSIATHKEKNFWHHASCGKKKGEQSLLRKQD